MSATTNPTGGTFTISTIFGTTAPLPWNAYADKIQSELAKVTPANLLSVTGGPFPQCPVTIISQVFSTVRSDRTYTVNTAGLTGGSGISVKQEYLSDYETSPSQLPTTPVLGNNTVLISGTEFPEVISTSAIASPACMEYTFDGNGSVRVTSLVKDKSITIIDRIVPSVNLVGKSVSFAVYNPQSFPISSSFQFYGTWPATGTAWTLNLQLQPGWNHTWCNQTNLPNGNVPNLKQVQGLYVSLNSLNTQSSDDPSNTIEMYFDSLQVCNPEKSSVCIGWDDGFVRIHQIANPIIQKYPGIKHCLFVVRDWTLAGKRWDNVPTLTVSLLNQLYATGQYLICNHSATHGRFESGINPAFTGTLSRDQAVRWDPSTLPTGGTFRLTMPGYGTTGAIPYNATIRQLRDAVASLVGEDRVQITSWTTTSLSASYGLRIAFSEPFPILTLSDPDGNVNQNRIRAGAAYAVADIVTDYENNRQFLLQNGWVGGEDIVAYPEGSFGPAVDAAMNILGMRGARIMTSKYGNYATRNRGAFLDRFALPALNFGGNLPKLIQQCEMIAEEGGHLGIMLHDISYMPGQTNRVNAAEFEMFLQYLYRNQHRVKTQTYAEYFSMIGI